MVIWKSGWLGLLVWLALAAAIQLPLSLNHDAAWHFQTSFRILAGEQLGTDVFDINPPMSAWLFTLPALAVELTGLPASAAFKLFTIAVCALGYLASLKLLGNIAPARTRWIVASALGVILFVMPGYDFAQREHLVMALVLPYVALAILRERGDDTAPLAAALIGLMAAIAICVKPYFLALPLSVEAMLLLRTGRPALLFRRENVVIGVFGVFYLVAVAIWAPDYYLRVVPDALTSYDGLESAWGEVFVATAQLLVPPLACLLLVFLITGKRSVDGTVLILLAAAAGFLIAALLQKKGWAYQLYPATAFILLAAASAYALKEGERTVERAKVAVAGMMALWAVAVAPTLFLLDGYASQGTSARVAELRNLFVQYAAPTETVYAFITSPRDIHPAVLESGRTWAGASGAMLYLPAQLNAAGRSDQRVVNVAARERQEMFTRLAQEEPAVIAVDNKPNKLGISDRSFDYLAYFGQFPEFRGVWAKYREIAAVGPFRIFVRKESQRSKEALTQTAVRQAFSGNR